MKLRSNFSPLRPGTRTFFSELAGAGYAVEEFARRPWSAAEPQCRFDDFTADIVENQLFRCTLQAMLSWPQLAPHEFERVAHCFCFEGFDFHVLCPCSVVSRPLL